MNGRKLEYILKDEGNFAPIEQVSAYPFIINEKIDFSFKLTHSELGIVPGTLELGSPAEVVSGLGAMGGSYGGAEVFSDEIATLLNDYSVYRETSYQVFIPYDVLFIPRVLGYVRSISPSVDPWGFLRGQLSVSYLKAVFRYFIWFAN